MKGKRASAWMIFLLSVWMTGAVPLGAATPNWTMINGDLVEGLARDGKVAVYDSFTNYLIVFGGVGFSGPKNDLWYLVNANGLNAGITPQWGQAMRDGAPGSPPPRAFHSVVYDETNSRLIVFGGCLGNILPGGGNCAPMGNDTWVLTNANSVGGKPAWIQLLPAGTLPTTRSHHVAVYDPNSNSMIVYGGETASGPGPDLTDVWVLSHANGLGGTPTWTQLSPVGGPPNGHTAATGVYDAAHNVLTVFGGIAGLNRTFTNAVWTLANANGLDGTTPTWTNLVSQGIAPGLPFARMDHTAVYDPGSNRMTILGGASRFGPIQDAWVLSNADGLDGTIPTWTKLSPTVGPPFENSPRPPVQRVYHNAVLDVAHNLMIVSLGAFIEGPLLSTWVLSDASGL